MTAAYACSDNVAVAKCVGTVPTGSAVPTSEVGSHTFTVTATDKSGNSATRTVTYTVVTRPAAGSEPPAPAADTTAPIVNLRAPVDGATYQLGETVRADYSCIDNLAIVTCDGTVADGEPIPTNRAGSHAVSVTAKDSSGNVATEIATYTVKDGTGPTITVTSPAADASFAWGQSVTAGYSCADDAAVVNCTATVADATVANGAALPTTGAPGPGTKTLKVEATDSSGNVTTKDVQYTVKPSGYYALTYDDGPHSAATDCGAESPTCPNYPATQKTLDALKSVGAKATFFLVGQNVVADAALVKTLADAGMTLASHTYTHVNFGPPDPSDPTVPATVTEAQAADELQKTQAAIQAAAGVTPTFFRPPYGQYDAQTVTWLAPFGLALTAWTVDTNDWTGIDATTIARNAVDGMPAAGEEPATSGIQPGGIILMHDNSPRTADATPLIVNRLRDEKGLLPGRLALTTVPQPGPYGDPQPAYYVEAVVP